jgi:hypothetical protein
LIIPNIKVSDKRPLVTALIHFHGGDEPTLSTHSDPVKAREVANARHQQILHPYLIKRGDDDDDGK